MPRQRTETLTFNDVVRGAALPLPGAYVIYDNDDSASSRREVEM